MAVIERIDIGRAADKLLSRLTRPGRGKTGPGRAGPLVTVVEIALVLMLGLVAGRVALTLFSPLSVAQDPPPPVQAVADEARPVGNPFRVAASAEASSVAGEAGPVTAETTLDLTLHGTWVDASSGSAIIQLPGGEHKTFFVGDAICCGARLVEVYAEQVVISRGGVREALYLTDKSRGRQQRAAPASRSQQAPVASAPAVGLLARFHEIVKLQPARAADGSFRLQIYPDDDEAAFEKLGFRSGDILISINGEPAPTNLGLLSQVLASLDGSSRATFGVERGGTRVSLDIKLDSNDQAMTQ